MKSKHFGLILLILITALILVACARPTVVEEVPEPPVVEQPAVIAPTETDPPKATDPPTETPVIEETDEPTVEETQALDDDERMQDLISEKIGGCHMLNFILSKNKTREEWSVTIDRMIGKGADVSAEEKELIIDYLVSRNE